MHTNLELWGNHPILDPSDSPWNPIWFKPNNVGINNVAFEYAPWHEKHVLLLIINNKNCRIIAVTIMAIANVPRETTTKIICPGQN